MNDIKMTEEDLEEGELGSEEDEKDQEIVDYQVLPRPIKVATRLLTGSSRTIGIGITPTQSSKNNNNNDGYYDSSSPPSSDDNDSEEDDEGPSRRKNMRMPNTHFNPSGQGQEPTPASTFVNPDPIPSSSSLDTFRIQAAAFQEKRRPNTIWSSVIQEEEASDILGKVNVEEYNEGHVLVERGPETYSVKYKDPRGPSRRRRRSESSSLSSGGLMDDEVLFLRGEEEEQGEQSTNMEQEGDGLPTQFGKQIKSISTKKLRQRRKRRAKLKNKLKRMNPSDLGHYIANKLQEPKHKLVASAIQLLGKEQMIELFFKTAKIERRGGLLVVNGQRRRTPGGVFLYLLRGDTKYPKKLVDKVFASDLENQRMTRKRQHKEKKEKRLQKLQKLKLENEKHEQEKITGSTQEEIQVDVDVEDDSNQPSPQEKDETQDDSRMSSDEDEEGEADIDSDEFCGMTEHPLPEYHEGMRHQIQYDDQEFLDIHCDASDLI